MRKTAGIVASLVLAASVVLTGTSANAASVSIASGGSSFSAGIITACAANYSGANVTYTSSSSGTGRAAFVAGTFDFAGSDGALTETFAGGAKNNPYTYVPVVGGPIAIIFNIPGVKTLKLDSTTVGKIFRGSINKWNDAAIVALNKTAKLPNQTIKVNYRNSKSGTNGNFSGYLAANGAAGWKEDQTWTTATGDATPTGTGAGSSSVLVAAVANQEYSVGYADLKDANGQKLSLVTLKNAAGQFVKPTTAGASKFIAGQSVASNGFVTFDWAKKVSGGYNASLITYAIVPTSAGTAEATAVKGFVNYMLKSCVPANATKLGYVSLTGAIKTAALNNAKKIK